MTWQDFQDKTARTELLGQGGDRITSTGLPAQDCLDKTVSAEQKGESSQNRTAKTGHSEQQPEQDSQNRTARTGQPE